MAILLRFQKVSLFKEEPFGISELSFEIERGRKYGILTNSEEQLNTLVGLLEGRFQKESGYLERKSKLFLQSDRLLLGDKVFSQTAEKWLALKSEFFQFGGRRRSKFGFIQTLNAKSILDYPIYKLDAAGKTKFALLALAFQESGITLISTLNSKKLPQEQSVYLERLVKETNTTCCLVFFSDKKLKRWEDTIPDLIRIDASNG